MLNYDIGIALGETSIHHASVGDPDLQDPHVFWRPGSRSINQSYGSGSVSVSFPFLIKGVEQTEIMLAKIKILQKILAKIQIFKTEDNVPVGEL